MTTWVLDASAAVEIVLRTPDGDYLTSHMRPGEGRWVPELFYAEVAATLRRMIRHGDITDARAERALRVVVDLRLSRARIAEMVLDAFELRHNLTVADALYVVLARSLPATLVSADRRLSRAPSLGVEVLTPP